MKKDEKQRGESEPNKEDEIPEADFQFVLKELVAAYQPILEEELRLAKAPDALEKEAAANPPNCEEEFALANRLFEKFFSEEVALRLLPRESREILGPIEQWR